MIFTSLFSTEILLYLTGIVVGVITLLYLFKLKRKRIEVPFSPIWQNVLTTSSEVESWRKYLRRLLSWLFFLVIAALILFAIYDPHSKDEATNARHILVLIDNSASMSSTDVSGAVNRFDLGRKKLMELLNSLDSQDRVMLATFNDVVQPQTPFISDLSVIKAALNQLHPTATTTNFSNAFSFAADVLQKEKDAELILVTDGAATSFSRILDAHPFDYSDESTSSDNDNNSDDDASTAEEEADAGDSPKNLEEKEEKEESEKTDKNVAQNNELEDANGASTQSGPTYGERLKNTTIHFVGVGESSDNIAITAFTARRYIANRLDYELLVQVKSYFDREIDASIDLFSDGKLVDTKAIKLAPRATYQQFYPSQAVSGERLEARVRITTNDAHDIFPMDDIAYTILPKMKVLDVLLVTQGNLYLEGPLLLNPNIRLKRVTPGQYQAMSEEERAKYKDIILDNVVFSTPPTSNTLYINPIGENSPWPTKGKSIVDPIIARAKKSHPLLRWMSLQDMNIRTAQRTEVSRGDNVVGAAVDGTPMIIAREEPNRRLVGLTFDIRESDFPLRVSFPVFMINVLDWFSGDSNNLSQSFYTGESWKISLPDGVERVEVTPPTPSTGFESEESSAPPVEKESLPVFDHHAYLYGANTGFYTIDSATPGKPYHTVIAANLADRNESNVEPHQLNLSDEGDESAGKILVARQMPWIWLVIAAFILLIFEWFTYNRRITE